MVTRRHFLARSTAVTGLLAHTGSEAASAPDQTPAPFANSVASAPRQYNDSYTGDTLNRVAFPLGGIGAGTICMEGTGRLSAFALRHKPDVFNEPNVFAAVALRSPHALARVLEGPVRSWKLFGQQGAATGWSSPLLGLPRFREASYRARFPFGETTLSDEHLPMRVTVTGWSPFEPGDADNASLPVLGLEYQFHNRSSETVEAVFSFNAANFMANDPDGDQITSGLHDRIEPFPGGFVLQGAPTPKKPWDVGSCAIWTDDPQVKVNHAWFRGGNWATDSMTMAWKDIENAACFDRPPITDGTAATGATLFVPFKLAPGQTKTIRVRFAWHVPNSDLRTPGIVVRDGKSSTLREGRAQGLATYEPWYAQRFSDIHAVAHYWHQHYAQLKQRSQNFSTSLFSSSLPPEVMEAVAANLSILKSPTVLRQADGRFWGWEGSDDAEGSCEGSCTHVWNYAQALPHLFPALERSLRETEFGPNQGADGRQNFRAGLPIRPVENGLPPAADGQLGGIMKVYRDWRISADTNWLRGLWPKVRQSLDFCVRTWDPGHQGWLEEPHHNTYDIEFWGPEGMGTTIYAGALQAAVLMGQALNDIEPLYEDLLQKSIHKLEHELFNGEYFQQKIQWTGLRAKFPDGGAGFSGAYSAEALALAEKEGPRYQYGSGCLSDGVLGSWLAWVCGLPPVLDTAKVKSHLLAVHRHNLKPDLSEHANTQRSTFACGAEGGLLLCSWPRGGELSLPFVYSDEVWSGIEYQVASHLIATGCVEQGLDIVRACRSRYDGRIRNPFDEYEAGHWYARALSSYALLQAFSGARYDAVEQVLHLTPPRPGDYRCFLAWADGYGTVGVRRGEPFVDIASGKMAYRDIRYTPCSGPKQTKKPRG